MTVEEGVDALVDAEGVGCDVAVVGKGYAAAAAAAVEDAAAEDGEGADDDATVRRIRARRDDRRDSGSFPRHALLLQALQNDDSGRPIATQQRPVSAVLSRPRWRLGLLGS